MNSRAPDDLPESWQELLTSQGFFTCHLSDASVRNGLVSDEVLHGIASKIAQRSPGLSTGSITRIREEPASPYATLTRDAVPFHNDGLYKFKPPHYLLLYCDQPATTGGETLLARGDIAYQRLSCSTREALTRRRVRIRLDEYCITRSLIETHPLDDSSVLLFMDPEVSRNCTLEIDGQAVSSELLDELRDLISSVPPYRHTWRAGDLLLIDNFKTIHARAAFEGERELRRIVIGPHASKM
jgi:alpha-ketoglutarate-dependent taurine dioxygenase